MEKREEDRVSGRAVCNFEGTEIKSREVVPGFFVY